MIFFVKKMDKIGKTELKDNINGFGCLHLCLQNPKQQLKDLALFIIFCNLDYKSNFTNRNVLSITRPICVFCEM